MHSKESGAAAVELALVLPILISLLLGTLEFGYLLFLNGSAAGAAREGAREMAITGLKADAQTVATDYFRTATGHTPTVTTSIASCTPGERVVVTVRYTDSSLTGFFKPILPTVAGRGEMRCGG